MMPDPGPPPLRDILLTMLVVAVVTTVGTILGSLIFFR